jgi:hypothetical protein
LVYSAAFWLSILYYRRTGRNGVTFGLVLLLLGHAVVIIAFAARLRNNYRQQINFNTRVERLREQLGLPPAEP